MYWQYHIQSSPFQDLEMLSGLAHEPRGVIGRASRRSRPEFPKAFDSFVGTKPVSPVARPSSRVLCVEWLDQSDLEWTGELSKDENEESDQ